jgi:redox-sensitive bicupin YhaK (pirin superfamily)
VSGHLQVDNDQLIPQVMTSFSLDGDTIEITALEATHFILFGGTPLNEPIVGYASFVMNNKEQIRQVMTDYHSGKMGTVTI